MKSKNVESPSSVESQMARRLRRSLLVGGLVALTALGGWHWVRTQPQDNGIPWALRQVHEWNARLWAGLFSPARPNRPSASELPPAGKKPRFNGSVGLDEDDFDPAEWQMEVFVEGARKFSLAMKDLRWLPRVETSTEFRCIEGWSDVISYAGVRFSEFMQRYNLPTDYRYVGLETPDGEYYVSIDMDSMLHPQTLLAYEMNGQPLSLPNGAPLRLIIPVKYGIKSLKRIGAIRLSNTRPPDYWAERGYDWYSGL